ncbi:sialate O-acetylesterase [Limnoglobus roseus]|uniref:Putative carbohydrate esterase (Sialic acid-specific acetylesterase) n=1 Tax=Limnoglobus roseus TaxID=2598579 RepID=A0A5C1ALJ5_9BACT|nr:sialate O-acetylesterase [Limnoglobus roseus]QEL20279.1 putative carbohydrate esterase (sialic acid-specific acetylesterase) [Limnoglobus roseus]
MRFLRLLLLTCAAGVLSPVVRAEVKLHPMFSDHMVLQQKTETTVWGTATPNADVSVGLMQTGGDKAVDVLLKAGADGKWVAKLPPQKAGTGYTLTAQSGGTTVTLKDVAVGEVWLCSGQSNMEWMVKQLNKDGQAKKVADAATNKNIRLFTVPNRPSAKPEADFPVSKTEGLWLECNPENVMNFSAVGYFFGRDIQNDLKVPVGLIASDWGGTSCQSWTSREALTANSDLKYYVEQFDTAMKGYDPAKADESYKAAMEKWKAAADKAKADGKQAPTAPRKQSNPGSGPTTTTLFNGMIAPITHYAIKGAIWYQGESNAGRAAEYYTLFPAMITDWRKQWGYDFPFFAVQLAPYKGATNGPAGGLDYAELRDAQVHATKTLKHVGIAIITDAGDENDIHPQKKEPAGDRLALAARAVAYGEKVEYQGPTYKSMTADGGKVKVAFDHAAGLSAKGDSLNGFAVCGEDKKFYPAKATIEGENVIVTSESVAKPVAVRYGWVNFAKPELNLFNKAGLPAVPFRSDNFPLTTATTKK